MPRALTTVAATFIAVVLQVTLVNRLPLPHGAVPSLVLVLVAVLSVRGIGEVGGGAEAGAIIGFCAGLAVDIAPPGSHLAGEYALVYCLIGYACGRAGQLGDLQALPAVLLAAAGAAAGEALSAVLGVMLSDPEVTWTAAKSVLPAAIIYDVLLTPFVFGLMSSMRPAISGARLPLGGRGLREGHPPRANSSPKLKLAGIPSPAISPRAPRPRREPKLRLAGITTPAISPRAPRRDPKLRLSGSGPAHTRLAGRPAAGRPVRVAFGPQPRGPLASLAGLVRPRRRTVTPGHGWLKSKPARRTRLSRKTRTPRYASKKWIRTSRRRRTRSRLGGLR